MNIEMFAASTPEKSLKNGWILPWFTAISGRKIALLWDWRGNGFKEMVKFVHSLYNAYMSIDASMFEINPVLKTSDNRILAVDGKGIWMTITLFRHKDLAELRDITEEDPLEVEAGKSGLNYVKWMETWVIAVNGAGPAMATMDIIKLSGGGRPTP